MSSIENPNENAIITSCKHFHFKRIFSWLSFRFSSARIHTQSHGSFHRYLFRLLRFAAAKLCACHANVASGNSKRATIVNTHTLLSSSSSIHRLTIENISTDNTNCEWKAFQLSAALRPDWKQNSRAGKLLRSKQEIKECVLRKVWHNRKINFSIWESSQGAFARVLKNWQKCKSELNFMVRVVKFMQ